jgi:hypothetical protein
MQSESEENINFEGTFISQNQYGTLVRLQAIMATRQNGEKQFG